MKRYIYFLSALAITALCSCSSSNESKDSSDSSGKVADPKSEQVDTVNKRQGKTDKGQEPQVLEDINAGEAPVAMKEKAAADVEEPAVATMDIRDAVALLTNDKVLRPGMKVNRLTIMDFNATWCGPCRQFAPVFEKAAEKYGNRVDFYSIDVDNNPATAKAFGIEAIPTVIIMRPDGKTQTFVGTEDIMPAAKFEALINANLR